MQLDLAEFTFLSILKILFFFSVRKLKIWKLKKSQIGKIIMRIDVHVSWISLYRAVVYRILIAWWSGFKLLRKIFVFCHFYFPWFSENLSTPNSQPLKWLQQNVSTKKHFTQKYFCRCACQKIVPHSHRAFLRLLENKSSNQILSHGTCLRL